MDDAHGDGGDARRKRGSFDLVDESREHCADGVRHGGGNLRRLAGDGDIDEDRVELARSCDVAGDLFRGACEAEFPNDLLAHARAAHELHVGGNTLLGELRALVGGTRALGDLRRDVHPDRGGELGRTDEPRSRGGEDRHRHGSHHDDPALTQYPQVVLDGQANAPRSAGSPPSAASIKS